MGVSTHILVARRARERAASVVAAQVHDPEALPAGYWLTGGTGGYWTLYAPGGVVVHGPSNGKWQGRDGAADGAWLHWTGR